MARVGCGGGGGQIAHKWPTICRSSEAWLTLALSIEPEIFLNFHHHKILNQNVNKSLYRELTYLPYNLHSCSDIGLLKKSLGQVLAWKSGLKVPLQPLGPSCPLQTILLSDLVGVTARCR
jgi:hypothetical protein